MSTEAEIERTTAGRYFEILEDTLLINRLDPFSPKVALGGVRRIIKHPSFYFFDHNQLSKLRISFYRTESGAEVDFVIEKNDQLYAIEVKCSSNVGTNDLKGLASFSKYIGNKKIKKRVFCTDAKPRKLEDVDILPWQIGLQELFS